jgi:hypothetical protein
LTDHELRVGVDQEAVAGGATVGLPDTANQVLERGDQGAVLLAAIAGRQVVAAVALLIGR